MHIHSVNVGRPRLLEGSSFQGTTGIFKEPVSGRIALDTLGLAEDSVLNEEHHGGPDQAVYLYRQEDYDWWSGTLNRRVGPGTFGDNLTVTGLAGPDIAIGTRLVLPHALLEVSAPRIPCNTLAERMGDARFAKAFIQAERPGIYCRVLSAGTVGTGDAFTLDTSSASDVTIVEIFRTAHRKLSRDELVRFLAAPIDIRTRQAFEKKLSTC